MLSSKAVILKSTCKSEKSPLKDTDFKIHLLLNVICRSVA